MAPLQRLQRAFRPVAGRGAARLIAVVALAGIAATACVSRGDPRLQELGGWRREAVLGSDDGGGEGAASGTGGAVIEQVATAATARTLAWFTGTLDEDGEAADFAYQQLDADRPEETTATGDGNVIIPVGLAADADGWVAVAVTRDRPGGENTGLLAWQGTTEATSDAPTARRLPPADEVPAVISTARADGIDLVVGPVDGEVLAWRNEDTGLWRRSVLDLGLEDDVVFLDAAGLGDRLVLAGVDERGVAHLWVSSDGEDWQAVDVGELTLPSRIDATLTSVTLPAPLSDDELVVVWMWAEAANRADPRSGSFARVQRFDGETLTDEGAFPDTGNPRPGFARFAMTGATTSPQGHLVVAGRAAVDDTTVPMLWLREDEVWQSTPQRELAGRLGYQFRGVTTDDDGMAAVVTPWPTGGEVEVWRWSG